MLYANFLKEQVLNFDLKTATVDQNKSPECALERSPNVMCLAH